MTQESLDQKHPQSKTDRQIVNGLLQITTNPSDRNLVELARLIIRYRDFPGARDIQRDLQQILQTWQFTEEQLYQKTRAIHSTGSIYRRTATGEQQDWT